MAIKASSQRHVIGFRVHVAEHFVCYQRHHGLPESPAAKGPEETSARHHGIQPRQGPGTALRKGSRRLQLVLLTHLRQSLGSYILVHSPAPQLRSDPPEAVPVHPDPGLRECISKSGIIQQPDFAETLD